MWVGDPRLYLVLAAELGSVRVTQMGLVLNVKRSRGTTEAWHCVASLESCGESRRGFWRKLWQKTPAVWRYLYHRMAIKKSNSSGVEPAGT